jgi:hypothetical protein
VEVSGELITVVTVRRTSLRSVTYTVLTVLTLIVQWSGSLCLWGLVVLTECPFPGTLIKRKMCLDKDMSSSIHGV